MKNKVLGAALLVMNLIIPAAYAEVKIGFLGTLSGPGAPLGIDQYDGLMLAIAQKGGKLGGESVVVFKEDDQLRPDVGVQQARRLVEENKVDVVTGMTYSNVMVATYKPIVDANVVVLSSNAGPTSLAGAACSPNVFVSSWNNDELHEAGAQLVNDMHYRNVYLMAPNFQAGFDAIKGFKRVYKGKIAGEVYTAVGQLDYSSELAQLQMSGADAVYVLYPGGMGVNFVKQYRQAGLLGSLPLISVATIDVTTIGALKNLANGAITVAPYAPDLDNETNKQFVAAFTKQYGRIPSHYAAQSYDAANALDAAISQFKGKPFTHEQLAKALKAVTFPSVRGGNFKFRNNNFAESNFYRVDVVTENGEAKFKTKGNVKIIGGSDFSSMCNMKK